MADAEATLSRTVIDIAPPCDEECLDCVDVVLPDETLGFGPRGGELVEMKQIAVHADLPFARLVLRHDAHGLPLATGPPDLLACPQREIIRSVRLLI
jgi:hypothetical protein